MNKSCCVKTRGRKKRGRRWKEMARFPLAGLIGRLRQYSKPKECQGMRVALGDDG
jgi:hypothetical protein